MILYLFVAAVLMVLVCLWADTYNDQFLQDEASKFQTDYFANTTYHLYDNNVAFTSATLIGALNEASFPGYAAIAGITSAVGAIAGSSIPVTASPLVYTLSTTGGPYTMYGWYATDSLGNLVGGGTFASPGPYVLTTAGQTVTLNYTNTVTRVP